MNVHAFCRREVSNKCKDLELKVRCFDAIKLQSCYYEVYCGSRVGSYEGCCKWSSISKYLSGKAAGK